MHRSFKKVLARSIEVVIGRRNLVRLGRALLDEGRLDVLNDPSTNGERLVQTVVLDRARDGARVIAADIGANVGSWTRSLMEQASRLGSPEVTVHAFEPNHAAFELLKANLRSRPAGADLVLNPMALSDEMGERVLHVVGEAAGRNSLYLPYDSERTVSELVSVGTLDVYAEERGVGYFDVVKIDAEGHDLAVIHGAEGLLRRRAIGVLQFEYNHRWIDARCFLRDAFDLATPFGYVIGKVAPRGVEFYVGWDSELETYREGNYLLCRRELRELFPIIRWWNSA